MSEKVGYQIEEITKNGTSSRGPRECDLGYAQMELAKYRYKEKRHKFQLAKFTSIETKVILKD